MANFKKNMKFYLGDHFLQDELIDFQQVCLTMDPMKRPAPEELLEHPLLTKVVPAQHRGTGGHD